MGWCATRFWHRTDSGRVRSTNRLADGTESLVHWARHNHHNSGRDEQATFSRSPKLDKADSAVIGRTCEVRARKRVSVRFVSGNILWHAPRAGFDEGAHMFRLSRTYRLR